jgi:membrane protease YdiL (CAAX protease family)
MSTDSSNDEPKPRQLGKVPWNPWVGFGFGILVFIAAQITAGILVSLYPVLRGWSHEQAVTWLQDALIAQLSYLVLSVFLTIGGVAAFVKSYGKLGFRSIGLKKPKWIDPLYSVAAFPVYTLILFVTVSLAKSLIPALDINQAQDLGLNGRYNAFQLVLIFICLAGLAPVAEEILFRGFIYSSLKKALPLWGAVVITSSLFAAGHLAEGGSSGPLYIGAIDTFILSLVLIYLREKTGRLWAGIGLHSLKNIIAFISVFVVQVH